MTPPMYKVLVIVEVRPLVLGALPGVGTSSGLVKDFAAEQKILSARFVATLLKAVDQAQDKLREQLAAETRQPKLFGSDAGKERP